MDKIMITTAMLTILVNTVLLSAQRGSAASMTFFVTSVGKGDGGNLGGLSGADAHCFKLASAAGAAHRTWRAYLSTNGQGGMNARERIGVGPWFNYKGIRIASNVAELHSDRANINKSTALSEKGQPVITQSASTHYDILTGSRPDGTALPAPPAARGRGGAGGRGADGARGTGNASNAAAIPPDTTCRNWTSNAADGRALLGHIERQGSGEDAGSWNSAHASAGCSQQNLQTTATLFYCFAID
jgi:hypothetical protein